MSFLLGQFNGIVMSGHKVNLYFVLAAKFQKGADPLFVGSAADSRTSHPEPSVHLLYRFKGILKQSEILLHVRMFPKARQVGLVPHLHRPLYHLCFPIPLHEMAEGGLHQSLPFLIVSGRGSVTFPVKYRLRSPGQLFRHKSQLQKRTKPCLQIAVHNPVQVGEVILRLPYPVLLILLINSHVITEQPMSPDMTKANLLLHQL